MVGEKGILYAPSDNGSGLELLPADRYLDYKPPPHYPAAKPARR